MNSSLVADIGGTNARLALVSPEKPELSSIREYQNKNFASLEEVMRRYFQEIGLSAAPQKACFAVASPVLGPEITFTNNSWSFSIPKLKRDLGFEELHVINDFEAIARSLPVLKPADLHLLNEGHGASVANQTIAVVGPGTGLGVGASVPTGKGRFVPLASEGGHAAFSPQNETELYLAEVLREERGFVCIEDVLSGQGLENMFRIFAKKAGRSNEVSLTAKEITERALSEGDSLAIETLNSFCAILGSVAGDLALTLGARGGVYIAGDIVPRFIDFVEKSAFRMRFEAKHRYRDYVAKIPCYVIIGKHPGLVGAATYFETPRP